SMACGSSGTGGGEPRTPARRDSKVRRSAESKVSKAGRRPHCPVRTATYGACRKRLLSFVVRLGVAWGGPRPSRRSRHVGPEEVLAHPRGFREVIMRYLSLIRAAEQQGTPPQALLDALDKYVPQKLADGTVVTTGGLAPSSAGTRVRIRAGRITVTDGPFSESKEVIGGYAVIAAKTREEAIRSTKEFMQLHLDHWPGWEGECELRELVFLAP